MKNKKILIAGLISGTVLLNSNFAYSNMPNFNLTPYGGVDFGMQHFGFKSGYGDNLFKKTLPKGNLFVGVKFNDYFGVEGGYESTIDKTRDSTVYGGDMLLGNRVPSGALGMDYIKFSSRVKISGWHLGITGNYPVYCKETNTLSILGYVGVKHTNVKLVRNTTATKGTGLAEVNGGSPQVTLGENSKKNLLKLSVGLEYFFNTHFGLRALLGWENTAKLKPTGSANDSSKSAHLKNSTLYSVGIILK